MDARAVFHALIGRWTFSREIPNHGTMQGTASWTPMPEAKNALFYQEKGSATWNNASTPHDFFRNSIYKLEGNQIVIYFNEMPERVYHVLSLEKMKGTCQSSHTCKLDIYEGTYDFRTIRQGMWKSKCRVKGPKKDYEMTTVYVRDVS